MANYAFAFVLFYLAFLASIVWLWIIAARAIARAAFRKNRSYKSFFWLTFVFSPILLALIVAILPFDASDKNNPQNVRVNDPELAASNSGELGNQELNRGFLVAISVLIGLGVIIAVATSVVAAFSAGQSSSEGGSQSSTNSSGSVVSNNPRALESALIENCTQAPTPLKVTIAKDGSAGHFLVTGRDGSAGSFYLMEDASSLSVIADSSDDISGAWVCGAFFTVSK